MIVKEIIMEQTVDLMIAEDPNKTLILCKDSEECETVTGVRYVILKNDEN